MVSQHLGYFVLFAKVANELMGPSLMFYVYLPNELRSTWTFFFFQIARVESNIPGFLPTIVSCID